MDPDAPDVMAQSSSLDVGTAFQFWVDDPDDLGSSGYMLKDILKELRDETIMITRSPTIAKNKFRGVF